MRLWWVIPAVITVGASTAILTGSRWALTIQLVCALLVMWLRSYMLETEQRRSISR